MKYQIDFLAVGDKQCGDAIAIRFGDLESGDPARQTVIQIDGGYSATADQVLEHHRTHFNAQHIDLLISTHPDIDHITGMPAILEGMPVHKLWMHMPAEHSGDLLLDRQYDYKVSTLTKKIQNSLQKADDLQVAAEAVNIPITEPFTGLTFTSPWGKLTVLGPTKTYYEECLAEIVDQQARKTAQPATISSLAQLLGGASQTVVNAAQKALGAIESHHIETLTDGGKTTPSNNTSTVLLLELNDGQKFLFTGDAGMPALEYAHGEFVALGHTAGTLNFVQVPHHGSRKNIGPSVLTKFLGSITEHDQVKRGVAAVSVGTVCDNHGHPHRVATNAFKRRGYPVWQTRGKGLKFGFERFGWSAATVLPLYESVETDD